MPERTILIATADDDQREFIARELDADAFNVYEADSTAATIAKLTTHATDVLLLGELQRRPDSPALLRAIRAGQHERIHPAQPVITLAATDELTTLRAYEAGSDHHLAADTGYVVLRAVIATVMRRTDDDTTSRHLHIGDLHIDTASRIADIAGTPVKTSRLEFELLCRLASDPTRVFAKQDLMQAIWGYSATTPTRTLDSHATRLRSHLKDAGGDGLVKNVWGTGYALRGSESLHQTQDPTGGEAR
jgi:DNA-binding response OmpR family regulator